AELMEGLNAMNFEKPTPIQQQAIPLIMQGRDLIACAQTGTGKTAAFVLPVINELIKNPGDYIHALIIVPTRELAIQIDEALQGFAYFAPVSHIAIYGGTGGISFEQEKKALTQGANIIIATPGRLIAHLNMGYVQIDKLGALILDEADRMLDMGFMDDISKIISFLPKQRQTLLFSATMPPKIRELAKKILNNPEQISISISKPAEGVLQGAYVVYDTQKVPLLIELLQSSKSTSTIIFSSTKEKVKLLERELLRKGLKVSAIHSDLDQDQRNDVMRQFRNRNLQILVATDILSRGIDIDSIGVVINYDVPGDAEDYVHRVGRTARAESTGVALTFINPHDQRKFARIEELIGSTVHKIPVPAKFGESPAYDPGKKTEGPRRRFGGHKGKRRK
ncbi:MAG TPA: DEAD/DEAH box helicase, partial [Chitinophagales bacterium]|nr:DEAD/DEAH box helicase [Chitinophagales bacterium]